MVKFIRFTTLKGAESGVEVIAQVENLALKADHTSSYQGENSEWTIFVDGISKSGNGILGFFVTKEEFERVGRAVLNSGKGDILEKF